MSTCRIAVLISGGGTTLKNLIDQIAAGKLDRIQIQRVVSSSGKAKGLGYAEEAGIPESLSRHVRPIGAVSYLYETAEGLKPDVMINFDLELPEDFIPQCTDGEVDRFELLPLAEVAEIVRSGFDFKFNCALVVIDFLIRHGYLTADNEPSYGELLSGLHRPLNV